LLKYQIIVHINCMFLKSASIIIITQVNPQTDISCFLRFMLSCIYIRWITVCCHTTYKEVTLMRS
jgi:hypothetical protein